MIAPSIALDAENEIVYITNNDDRTEEFALTISSQGENQITFDDILKVQGLVTSRNLKTELHLAAGTYELYATACAENLLDSDPSDSIIYISTYIPEDNEDENQGETTSPHSGGSHTAPPMEGPW